GVDGEGWVVWMVGMHPREGNGHVEIRLDEVAAGVVPVDARDLHDPHAGQAVGAPLAHRGDVAPADARIALTGALHLDARLDHVAHGPDADGVARRGHRQIDAGDPRAAPDRGERRRLVDGEVAVDPARGVAEGDRADREAPQLKTHGPPPPHRPRADRTGSAPAPPP